MKQSDWLEKYGSTYGIGEFDPSTVKPTGNRVLIEVLEEEWNPGGRVIVPENVKSKSCQGVVVAASNEVIVDGELLPGDRVLFTPYQEETFTRDGKEYIITSVANVLGVME